MKKVILCFTLLFSFFLSPVKADSYEDRPYFFAYSYLDLTQLGMGNEVLMGITWYFYHTAPVKCIYADGEGNMFNMTNIILTGTGIIDSGNGTMLTATFTWNPHDDYATLNYMGLEFITDNWFPSTQDNSSEYTVGNGYEWWSDSSEETPSSDIDLSTIQTYLLIISFLLFISFLRG